MTELSSADTTAQFLARELCGPNSRLLGSSNSIAGLRIHGSAAVAFVAELLAKSQHKSQGGDAGEVRSVLVRYLGLLAAGTFTAQVSAISPLTAHLIESGDIGLCADLWRELAPDMRTEAFSRLFNDLYTLMKRQKLTDNFYKTVLQLAIDLVELQVDGVRVLARFLCQSDDSWDFKTEVPAMFERLSLLPALLSLSPFASEAVRRRAITYLG